jgi:hypothetical protein
MAAGFPRIDSVEIDHVHFENCGHSNVDAIGVTNLRIHDNTFAGSGYAGLAFPISSPCQVGTPISNGTISGSAFSGGNLVTVTTTSTIYPVVGDYVWIQGTGTTLNGLFKITNAASSSSYQIITNLPLPSVGGYGSTNLLTCDNGIWVDRNVMNDYGVSDNQGHALGTIGGVSLTYSTENHLTTLPANQGEVTGFVNVHITGNVIKCQSNGGNMTHGQNNKLTLRVNAVADSVISGNNLIACGAGMVSAENTATVAYHLGIKNNDFWNSALNTGCLLITQQTVLSPNPPYASCPNGTCGSQGYVVHGNRFHDCGFTDIYMTTDQSGAVIADNDIGSNFGDDTETGYMTFGLVFSNYGDGCNGTSSGCSVTVLRSHVHDNIWGGLPGTSAGNGVSIIIGNQPASNQANESYSSVITGRLDFWSNNSASSNALASQETGFVRRNLKDIYCASDQYISTGVYGDPDCDNYMNRNMTANSDYGGTGMLASGSFSHKWTAGPYLTAPVCAVNDTATMSTLTVSSSVTALTVTGPSGDTVAYTCEPLTSHN